MDGIRLLGVLELLKVRNIDRNILGEIGDLNNMTSKCIKEDNETSNQIPISTGIIQGESLSLIQFNDILDETIRKVKRDDRGLRMGNDKNEDYLLC